MTISKLKNKALAVPDEVLEELGLAEGDEFEVEVEEDAIVFRLHEEEERDPEIEALLEEGLEDLRAGRVTPAFSSSEEFEAYRKTDEYRRFVEADSE